MNNSSSTWTIFDVGSTTYHRATTVITATALQPVNGNAAMEVDGPCTTDNGETLPYSIQARSYYSRGGDPRGVAEMAPDGR